VEDEKRGVSRKPEFQHWHLRQVQKAARKKIKARLDKEKKGRKKRGRSPPG